jgi:hypothetical protein
VTVAYLHHALCDLPCIMSFIDNFFIPSRNMILSCWNKDVKHLLDLADCGLSNVPLKDDDLPRQTLIRDVYFFLDQNVSCIAYL